MSQSYDVAVIGAGPAGCMAAGLAASQGCSVLLCDRNSRIGRKLMITGKGRCNVTNRCDNSTFLAAVRTNSRFLYSALNRFSTQDTIDFFENLGLPLKTERGNRIFPVSDRAADVVDTLARYLRQNRVVFRQARCTRLFIREGAVCGACFEDQSEIAVQSVIIATGGASYPATGSTGDGYRLAEQAGHSVIPPSPSLIPIITKELWCKDLMGLSLRNVVLTVRDRTKKEKILFEELGEMLFTHFGISGPLVLRASSHMKSDNLSNYSIVIDLKPGLSMEQLDARLLKDFSKNINRDFHNSLSDLLPQKIIPVIVKLCGICPSQKVHQITKEQRRQLVQLIKGLLVTPCAFRPIEEAIVTAGGVNVKEINPKTMESKIIKGLYFSGEVLDVDAYTGGFNLQIAYSTGVLAGENAARARKTIII